MMRCCLQADSHVSKFTCRWMSEDASCLGRYAVVERADFGVSKDFIASETSVNALPMTASRHIRLASLASREEYVYLATCWWRHSVYASVSGYIYV